MANRKVLWGVGLFGDGHLHVYCVHTCKHIHMYRAKEVSGMHVCVNVPAEIKGRHQMSSSIRPYLLSRVFSPEITALVVQLAILSRMSHLCL